MSRAKAKRKAQKVAAPVEQPEPFVIVGPTEEARRHAAYERREVHKGERRPYVRINATLLDVLERTRILTLQHVEAGKRFAQDYARVWGSGTRDSCVLRIGGEVHETAGQAEGWAKARARMDSVLNRAGPMAYSLLRQICVEELPLGRNRGRNVHRYAALVSGLDACAVVYGVPEYDAA